MAKKRANGEGSIRKKPSGRWEGRYTQGIDPVTGRAIQKSVSAKTQAECKEKLAKAIRENRGVPLNHTGDYTAAEWCRLWFETYSILSVVVSIRPRFPFQKFFLAGKVLASQADDDFIGIHIAELLHHLIDRRCIQPVIPVVVTDGGFNRFLAGRVRLIGCAVGGKLVMLSGIGCRVLVNGEIFHYRASISFLWGFSGAP